MMALFKSTPMLKPNVTTPSHLSHFKSHLPSGALAFRHQFAKECLRGKVFAVNAVEQVNESRVLSPNGPVTIVSLPFDVIFLSVLIPCEKGNHCLY